jgi:hypothetical protein
MEVEPPVPNFTGFGKNGQVHFFERVLIIPTRS